MAAWLSPLLIAVLSFHAAQAAPAGCPNDLPAQYLRTFNGRCYLFATFEMRTWSESKASCNRNGGRLVAVRDQATQDFLAKTLTDMQYTKTGTWIGLSDHDVEGLWVWDQGENLTYTNWASGEPGLLSSVEDCALLKTNAGFQWGDAICDLWPQYHAYICEFGSSTGSQPQGTNPPAATTQKMAAVSVTYPSFCGDFACSKNCGASGYQTDMDGCPLCSCKTA